MRERVGSEKEHDIDEFRIQLGLKAVVSLDFSFLVKIQFSKVSVTWNSNSYGDHASALTLITDFKHGVSMVSIAL